MMSPEDYVKIVVTILLAVCGAGFGAFVGIRVAISSQAEKLAAANKAIDDLRSAIRDAIAALNIDLDRLEGRLEKRLDAMDARLNQVERRCFETYNSKHSEG
jgi:hypothetical protein